MRPFCSKEYEAYVNTKQCPFFDKVNEYITLINNKNEQEIDLRDDSPDTMWDEYDDILCRLRVLESSYEQLSYYADSYLHFLNIVNP